VNGGTPISNYGEDLSGNVFSKKSSMTLNTIDTLATFKRLMDT
jgi:hypothetical protein